MENFLSPALIWFAVGILFLFLEFAVPGVILFFFGSGALLTAILSWIGILDSLPGQMLFFIASSVILLITLRRYLKNTFMGRAKGNTNNRGEMSEFIGKRGKVIRRIVPDSSGGRIKFKGTDWNAEADETIEVGKFVRIISYDNITLKVEPISSEKKGE
ncbi:MAG: NfeD family protein [Candidatus Zixiibacteriota bacterium]